MPKKRKGGKEKVAVYNSDDEDTFSKGNEPDPTSEEYFMDDIDEFHAKKDKVLLGKGIQDDVDMESESEDEVLGLVDSDESDEEIRNYQHQLRQIKRLKKKDAMGSDLEEEEDEEAGLPDSKAWGIKKSKYYGGDVEDEDLDLSGSEDEEAAAVMEEKEALALQKKMAAELDEQDFDLDIFKKTKVIEEKDKGEEKIVKDLTKLSKREKIKLLKKESPELMTLIEDFKVKMTEVKDIYHPLLTLVKEGKIQGKAAEYVETKFKLLLNYCTNISFYMMLKSKQVPVQNHPVIKRLVQHRNLMKQLEPVDDKVRPEIEDILEKLNKGEEIRFAEPASSQKTFIRRKPSKQIRDRIEQKKLSELVSESEEDESGLQSNKKKMNTTVKRYETKDEKDALEYYNMMKSGKRVTGFDDEELDEGTMNGMEDMNNDENVGDDDEYEGKRKVTYQIEKNKNIQIKKKKEDRNPRVKLRNKFRKAKIRRKGQIREARTEMNRYGGEVSGIRAGIKRSVKIKT
ncbi:UTP3 [Mytilus coruscus]|uniref:UTP3 n=1 Tax=Mytilus coruscus TaxID=42192 RepID=A0A6J8CVZ3_MYTCO|nr:UTP3 [Mytilus coruscus]